MSRQFESLTVLKASAEKVLGRNISEIDWNTCRPESDPPYGDLDLRACLIRINNASIIPLYRSNLSMDGFWYRGDYDIDEDGYIFLREGGELEKYLISDEVHEIVDEFSALLAGIKEDEVASPKVSARLQRRILEFVRRRGLLGLAFLGFDAFLRGPSEQYMVAGGGSWTCPMDLYFLPYLKSTTDIAKLVFPYEFRLSSGFDNIQPGEIAERFFGTYREHKDDFINAILALSKGLGGFLFHASDGSDTYPSRTMEFFVNAVATPTESFSEDDEAFGTSLNFPSLISAIFLATVNMRKHGWRVKVCANEKCDSFFLSLPEDKTKRERLFCSTRCKNAQAYRNWYWSDKKKRKDGVHSKEVD